MRKYVYVGLTALLLMGLVSVATAADAKIGLLDSQQVLQNSTPGKANLTSIQAEAKKFEENVAKERAALQAKQQKLEQEISVMSQEARTPKIQAFEQEVKAFEAKMQKTAADVQAKERVFLEKMQQTIVQACNQIGKAEGYTVILDARGSGAYYAADGVDLTARVIDIVNKTYK